MMRNSLLLAAAILAASTAGAQVSMEKIKFNGWDNCIRLSNDTVELIATTDVGPRVMRYGFIGGQNVLNENPEDQGMSGGDTWRSYGGHRLWHAPEDLIRTYWPDNVPVEYKWDGKSLTLTQPVEKTTGIIKMIIITMAPKGSRVNLLHRTINTNPWDIELAPWCLTVMSKGGRLIFPQEEYRPHPDYVAAARPLVLWHYTNMADPRWTWGEKYIQLQQEPGNAVKEKVGAAISKGWAAYALNGEFFIKRFPYDPKAKYADMGCNFETFTNDVMLEIETLGPLTKLPAYTGSADHAEDWFLFKGGAGTTDAELDEKLMPLVNEAK